jgi:hypothetical protein
MSKGQHVADVAQAHVDCSEVLDVDRYNDVIVRPVDRTPALIGYYDRNKSLSTCALFAIGCLRLAGCGEPECVATYFPGGSMRNAMSDIQALARRFDAWVTSSGPVDPPKAGDIWIIADEHGMDAHTGVCLVDAALGSSSDANAPASTWVVDTAEGGQLAGDGGSSAVGKFTRTFRHEGNRWALGSRFLLGYASAEKMPVVDDGDPLPANPVQTDPHV